MDQFQGAIVDAKGTPLLNLHVSLRTTGTKWKGVIESPNPVPVEARPEQGKYYRLRLADGREKMIHVGPVTLLHSKNGDFIRATFDCSSPPKQTDESLRIVS